MVVILKSLFFKSRNAVLTWIHSERAHDNNYLKGKKLIHFQTFFDSSIFKLTTWRNIDSTPSSWHNSSKYQRLWYRRKPSLFLMMRIRNARVNFSITSSIKHLLSFSLSFIFIWFSSRIDSVFYIKRFMIT